MKKKVKNEATLESRVDNILNNVFPTFREVNVTHQQSFSIKFGHHNVLVNNKAPSENANGAIYDILLTIRGQNVILLELKKEGLKLKDEDIHQGISYARLIDQMPPITLISNGKNNRFYNTYTKEELNIETVDFTYLQSLIDNSFELALNDFKDAMMLLLNNEPLLFSRVINQISATKFDRLKGELKDFSKPICQDFIIQRNIIDVIQDNLNKKRPLIGLIGSAFSGKTNILYQFYSKTKSDKSFLLYIDCNDHNYSILQQLANYFSKETKSSISVEKIREWIINALHNSKEAKFYLLLDNFNDELPENIKNEIIELIDLFDGVNHFILYSIDEFNFKKIAYHKNRQYKTIIGDKSYIIRLDELNDDEYSLANDYMFENYKVRIEHGGHFTPEYREPRILRHLIAVHNNDCPDGKFTKILAVPDYDLLKIISQNKTYTKLVHDLYNKITICFFAEKKERERNNELSIAAVGTGAASVATFKKRYPNEFETLLRSSFVIIRECSDGTQIIYPKIPELISIHSIQIINEIIDRQKKKLSTNEICDNLLNYTTPVPYCDIVATGILLHIAQSGDVDLFSGLVQRLLEIPPQFNKISAGTKTIMFAEDTGPIKINFDDDMEEGCFIVDFLPYVILSQLAGYPLGLVDNEDYSQYAFHLYLLNTIGSNMHLLRRADVRSLKNMKQLGKWNWENVGEIISGNEGIIEPYVQSIQKCFFEIPNEIENLYNKAFEENNFPLLWRINLAIRSLVFIDDENLADKSNDFVNRFNMYFSSFMADFMTKDMPNNKTTKDLKEMLSSINIGEIK